MLSRAYYDAGACQTGGTQRFFPACALERRLPHRARSGGVIPATAGPVAVAAAARDATAYMCACVQRGADAAAVNAASPWQRRGSRCWRRAGFVLRTGLECLFLLLVRLVPLAAGETAGILSPSPSSSKCPLSLM